MNNIICITHTGIGHLCHSSYCKQFFSLKLNPAFQNQFLTTAYIFKFNFDWRTERKSNFCSTVNTHRIPHSLTQHSTFGWPSHFFYHYLHVDIWWPWGQAGPFRVLLGSGRPLRSALTSWGLLVSQRAFCSIQFRIWEQPVSAAVKQSLEFNTPRDTQMYWMFPACYIYFVCLLLSTIYLY